MPNNVDTKHLHNAKVTSLLSFLCDKTQKKKKVVTQAKSTGVNLHEITVISDMTLNPCREKLSYGVDNSIREGK